MPILPPGPPGLRPPGPATDGDDAVDAGAGEMEDDSSRDERERMVTHQIVSRGIADPSVVAAMRAVPRHLFVPPALRGSAYSDHPLPIGHGQTISQPFIVALMTELARPRPSDRALDIGTGSGYQAAILSRLVSHVFSIEIVDTLSRQATERLSRLGCSNVTVTCGDGWAGWRSEAPFEIVIVGAAPPEVPGALVDQLAPGGRLVIPVGHPYTQELCLIEKQPDGRTRTKAVVPVLFVPMVHGLEAR